MIATSNLTGRIEQRLLRRNRVFRGFFAREAPALAETSREMATRFQRGGRLLAFGRGAYATDAQHIAVEFVHPVIVGKRALPALDISSMFGPWLDALLAPEDIVVGFGPPEGDPEVEAALERAHRRGAMALALPGEVGAYCLRPVTRDPFEHQEILEILYHTLWETVHVFLEHNSIGQDPGESAFLYPFLGRDAQPTDRVLADAAVSICAKVDDDAALRAEAATLGVREIAGAATAIRDRIARGGKLLVFGNGGSATDANDFAFDCVNPPAGWRPVPALSLALDPAILTAVANDVGVEAVFLRQLIAQARSEDVAVAISTSGGSRNVVMALEEARKRGLLRVALLGYDGGEVVRRGLADFALVVRSDYIPRIQEVQASIYHVLRECLEDDSDA